jgi:hypothetical protein
MPRALWQLLLEDSSDLTCEECFALMEYYAETLTSGRVDLLPEILEHLEGCPDCELQHRMALRGLISDRFERSAASLADATVSDGSNAKSQWHDWRERGQCLGEEP